MHRDVDASRRNLPAREMYRARADVEGGDVGGALLGRGDRHNAAAGAQVGDAAVARQPGLVHDVDQQFGIFLRRINAVCDDRCIPVGVGTGQRRPFEGFSYWSSSGLMPHIGVVKTSATGLLYPQSVTPERVRSPRMARATRSACRYGTRRHSTSNKQCNACRRRKDGTLSSGFVRRSAPRRPPRRRAHSPASPCHPPALVLGPGPAALRLLGAFVVVDSLYRESLPTPFTATRCAASPAAIPPPP